MLQLVGLFLFWKVVFFDAATTLAAPEDTAHSLRIIGKPRTLQLLAVVVQFVVVLGFGAGKIILIHLVKMLWFRYSPTV